MKRITRAVSPEDLSDLLDTPPRANLAFNDAGVVAAIPVAFRFHDGRHLIGIPRESPRPAPAPDERVALLIDDGCYSLELRGVHIRGQLRPADHVPEGASSRLEWLEVVPERVIAWDYGTVREAKGS